MLQFLLRLGTATSFLGSSKYYLYICVMTKKIYKNQTHKMDILKRLLYALLYPLFFILGLIEFLVKLILTMPIIWIIKGYTPNYDEEEDWLFYRLGDYFKRKLVDK